MLKILIRQGITCVLLAIFLLATTSIITAQKPPISWDDIPQEDLNMTTYAPDPDADAVVLCDFGTATIEIKDDIEIIYTRHKRIKILTDEGAKDVDVSIPYHKKERIFKIQAQTINGSEKTTISKKEMFDEQVEGAYYKKKIAFPNVKAGSIIELRYSYSSPFFVIPNSWYFQGDLPVRWSECRFELPQYMEYVQVSNVFKPYDVKEVKDANMVAFGKTASSAIYRFAMKDMEALKEEAYITTMNDYRNKIQFQLVAIRPPSPPYPLGSETKYMTDWPDLMRRWMKADGGGRQFKYKANHKKILNDARDYTASVKGQEEKMKKLFEFIQKSYTWDGSFWRYGEEKNLNAAYETKSGNSAEINMSLLACLKDADIEAYAVLLSTRSKGKLQKIYPMIAQFNHLIVFAKVDGKEYVLDAVDDELAPNMIHPQALNGEGLLIQEDVKEAAWVRLAPLRGDEVININLTVDGDEAMADYTGIYTGYRARNKRSAYKKQGEEEYIEDRLGEVYDFEVEESEFTNLNKPGDRFIEKMNFSTSDAIDMSTGDNIYINPLLMEQMSERIFSLEKRNYPVDIAYPYSEKYIMNLSIPEGYEVIEQPKNIKLALPDNNGSYLYLIEVTGDKIQLRTEERLNKPLFTPEEYSGLKEFFDKIFDKEAEQIVLKKKS